MNSGSASSSPARPTTAGSGAGNAAGAPTATEEFHFPSELMSVHDRKDQALHVLKSDLMDSLNKEVKSLDEDNWMFEGPRSRIHLMSRPVGRAKSTEVRHGNFLYREWVPPQTDGPFWERPQLPKKCLEMKF